MKYLILLLLLLILPTAYAAFDPVEKTIQVGEVIDEYTRTVELVAVSENEQAVIRVDNNFTEVLDLGETKEIEGVEVHLNETFYVSDAKERKATIKMTVIWQHLCNTDADCEPENACEKRFCTGWPRRCDYDDSIRSITECIDDDLCCPKECNYFEDSDCIKPCEEDKDCDDNDVSTRDECDGDADHPGKCHFIPITECKPDDYCPPGCSWGTNVNETTDRDCSQLNECSFDTDCDDNNPETIDACVGFGSDEDPRSCTHAPSSVGCVFNDGFCPPQCSHLNDNDCPRSIVCGDDRCEDTENCENCLDDCGCIDDLICRGGECIEQFRVCDNIGERGKLDFGGLFYCSEQGWKSVKAGSSVCANNYECASEICGEDGRCVSVEKVAEERSRNVALILLAIFLVGVAIYFYIILKIHGKAEHLDKI